MKTAITIALIGFIIFGFIIFIDTVFFTVI